MNGTKIFKVVGVVIGGALVLASYALYGKQIGYTTLGGATAIALILNLIPSHADKETTFNEPVQRQNIGGQMPLELAHRFPSKPIYDEPEQEREVVIPIMKQRPREITPEMRQNKIKELDELSKRLKRESQEREQADEQEEIYDDENIYEQKPIKTQMRRAVQEPEIEQPIQRQPPKQPKQDDRQKPVTCSCGKVCRNMSDYERHYKLSHAKVPLPN